MNLNARIITEKDFEIQQNYAIENYNILLSNLDSNLYAGSYINEYGKFVVLLLEGIEDDAKAKISSLGGIVYENIEYKTAENSKEKLDIIYSYLLENMKEFSLHGLYTDVINNTINVDIEMGMKNRSNDLMKSLSNFSKTNHSLEIDPSMIKISLM